MKHKMNDVKQKHREKETIIWPQHLNTYLGNKGYTIHKAELTPIQIKTLKEMLTIKPYVPGAPVQTQSSFPVYRESSNKLYIPRYFGEEYLGPPKEIKITEGENTDLFFQGTLRDYQEPVVGQFLNYVSQQPSLGGLLELPCAWGKTSASLYICSQLKKKTLVIVHKEFLMNQWVERIQQFLPTARIGKIQGQIIDIENKDIVLCMLQSLSMKEYPSSTFDSFGFTIIDEVHHISSETFSNALFKLVTKYMLGLSATMERKDGTSKVFKMFLGKVVHQVERKKGEHNVQIRAITYKTNDDEFNKTVLDYRGSPQTSTMISKLCSYDKRTDFIIRVLSDFIKVSDAPSVLLDKPCCGCELCGQKNNFLVKNTCCNVVKYCLPCMLKEEQEHNVRGRPKCVHCKKVLKYEQHYIENPNVKPMEQLQTLVLSHNLNVLHYMYNRIVNENIASVGYYVGGMKEADLKRSEKKQIILASFAMASEALDIPSLNAAFFITPKTDVVQCVGRVLRAKHAFADPVIYDIKDSHPVFHKQWLKRKAYYKHQNYHIVECDSYTYQTNTSLWKSNTTTNAVKSYQSQYPTMVPHEEEEEDEYEYEDEVDEEVDEEIDEEKMDKGKKRNRSIHEVCFLFNKK